MKYKAKYSAESEIPADVKTFYVLQDGEWVFNGSKFEGLDALLNPGLAANRDSLKAEKQTVVAERDAVVKERDQLQATVNKLQKPGTIFMSADEQKTLDGYKALGTLEDVKKKLENEKIVSEKLNLFSTEKEIRQIAKRLGLNEDALVDFKLNSERGKDVVLAVETIKQKDAKGVEVEKEIPVVQITDIVNGVEKISTKPFATYAKEKGFPEYLVTAIFNGEKANEDHGKPKNSFFAPPSLKTKAANDDSAKVDVSKVVSRFNQGRSTRKLPWSTAVEENKNT